MTASRVEPALRWALPFLTLVWVLFLFWVFTSTRGAEGTFGVSPDPFHRLIPTAAHLGGYGVLAGLIGLNLWGVTRLATRFWAVLATAFLVATVYGAALELYQTTLPSRYGSWGDVGLNAAGASAALVALTALRRWRPAAAARSPER